MDIIVPQLGESVSEATVAKWFKRVGDSVIADETVVELETDKVTLEINAPATGVLASIASEEGVEVLVGAILGEIETSENVILSKSEPIQESDKPLEGVSTEKGEEDRDLKLSPSVRKLVSDHNLDLNAILATGKGGRHTKGDVLSYMECSGNQNTMVEDQGVDNPGTEKPLDRLEERVRMTRLRTRIAERLKEAQNTAAMLTTFNEVNMSSVLDARRKYQEKFESKHGVRLGFMSFFAKACITALGEITAVNAMIDGNEIIYRHYVDLGIAVGTDQGLVVPVLRDAHQKSFSEIEKSIGELGKKARAGELSIQDLTGGTFTITNGGVYGSLMSTPIINPPQSAILGMHKIEERPIAIGGQVVIRPMMYLALSYDHRIIDGAEAVTFLVRVKECIEEPERILFDI
ncbi:MAG: 2-oxoglutarate dehydrogenase complex dihydrolipoyllysine-residue succinyltransferase [Rhodospirillaceae bacterium]